ncbi:MAG TPA: LacI family DNA-binding transcriptional regulator [Fimbriimonas sp.]|nr:LacI family DNA-binding transcriptional regulator [Fimbriimonas sp.]
MATLKEIAEMCGVSTATVSYVASGRARAMRPETRERVTRKLIELGYHPNAHARGLQGLRTNTIGIVFDHVGIPFDNSYFGPILQGILAGAAERHLATLLFTDLTREEMETSASRLCDGRCDGFILVAPIKKSQLVSDLLKREVPIVVIGTHPDEMSVTTVDCDNVEGARLATRHLIELGHRRIGAVGLRSITGSCTPERLAGYRMALEDAGLSVDESLVAIEGPADSSQDSAIRLLLCYPKGPTALFCTEAPVALEALNVAADMGLRVPGDLSVVGFDDVPQAAVSDPPLTTVRQPMRTIGTTSVELLAEEIEERRATVTSLLDVELIVRGSTTSPRA